MDVCGEGCDRIFDLRSVFFGLAFGGIEILYSYWEVVRVVGAIVYLRGMVFVKLAKIRGSFVSAKCGDVEEVLKGGLEEFLGL